MATEDRNGALHSESNGQFVSKGKSDEQKIREAERVYNTHGHLSETAREFANGLRQPPSRILTETEIKSIKNDAISLGIDETILRFNTGKQTGFNEILIGGERNERKNDGFRCSCRSKRRVKNVW